MARNLLLRCLTCNEEHSVSSMSDWSSFVKHKKGHNPKRIYADTGRVLASALNTVQNAHILPFPRSGDQAS